MMLHLIRHGQTDWNAIRRIQGHSESTLSELGRRQALELAPRLAEYSIAQVYCSSSQRTRETAALLFEGTGIPVGYMDELREIFLGPWEGRLYDEIEAESPEDFRHFWQQPHLFSLAGAESFRDLQQRGVAAVQDICSTAPQDDVAIVSHGAIIKSILCHFEGRDLARLWEPPQMHNCSHSIVEISSNGRARILRYADLDVTLPGVDGGNA